MNTKKLIAFGGMLMLCVLVMMAGNVRPTQMFSAEEETEEAVPAIVDNGIYHLFAADEGGYLARGGKWGTQATIEPFGKPIAVMSKGEGTYSLRYVDYGNAYLGIDGGIYTDKSTNFPIYWQFVPVNDDTFKLYNPKNGVYLAVEEGTNRCVPTADEASSLTISLVSEESYKDFLSTVNPLRETAEGMVSIDLSDMMQNATMESGIQGWEGGGYREGTSYAVTNRAGVNEVYENCGEIKQVVTGLVPNELYRFSIYGFYRGGANADCAELYNSSHNICTAYIYANDDCYPLASWASQRVSNNAPNSMEAAAECFAEGKYLNYVVGRADSEGTLVVGLVQSQYMRSGWLIWGAAKLEQIGGATTAYKQLLEVWIDRLQTLIDTKKILSEEQKAEASYIIEEAQQATSDEELLVAIENVKAVYDELEVYRIPVDRSDEIEKYKGYLFAFFPSNSDENLYYAYSDDGFNYTVLNNGKRVMASDTVAIKKGIRDPHILRGADGKTFYMVATDMRSAEGWSSNRGIVLYKSTDMIHWQHSTVHFPTRFPDGWSSVTRVWAPEVIWDANYQNEDGTKGRYLVYFSLLTSDDGTCTYDKVYYCYANDDFTDLLDYPVHFYDRGSATIDADIVFDETDRLYHMIYKNEGSGGIMHVTAETLTPAEGQPTGSQWSTPTGSVQQTNVAVEGGGIFRLIGENTWVVMYDCYNSGYYEFCTTTDWIDYTLSARTTTSGAFTPRHGTVIPITTAEYNALIKAFPTKGLEPVEDEATGLNGIESSVQGKQDGIYTITGARVAQPTQKGIYIINKKKVIR